MLILFTSKYIKTINNDNAIKLLAQLICPVENNVENNESDVSKIESYYRCHFNCKIQYNNDYYYVRTTDGFKSFIVTGENDEYVVGNLISLGSLKYTVRFYKKNSKWERYYDNNTLAVHKELCQDVCDQIQEVLLVMEYKRIITNVYYLLHNINILPDICIHMYNLLSTMFPKNIMLV